MKSFKFNGVVVEVEDSTQLEKIGDILDKESYSMAALYWSAPAMMRAIEMEFKTCTDRKTLPKKLVVKAGKVKAELSPDRRANKDGIQIGNG